MKKSILETERLRLRPFTLADSKFIIELVNTPGWLEFIGDRNIKTVEQAKEYLTNGPLKSYELNGYGLSMVEMKHDGTAIGMCGIIKRELLDNPDIGFALLPAFFGKGYAYEIANATMGFAKNTLKLSPIYAITLPNNISSIKLLEKIGLKYSKKFCFPGEDEELLLYSN
jgi:RimJ/RimL family protein N-acetyltransferase